MYSRQTSKVNREETASISPAPQEVTAMKSRHTIRRGFAHQRPATGRHHQVAVQADLYAQPQSLDQPSVLAKRDAGVRIRD